MPLMSGCWASRVCSAAAALPPSHSVGSAKTVMPGNLVFMQSPNASDRSRPLTEESEPWNSMTLPWPASFWPRNSQAFCPYARLSARTTMNTLPLSGRVSTETTGIFLDASVVSVEAIAPVSCGAITIALAPWLTRAWVLATSLETSFCELVGGIMLTPRSVANLGTYFAYEFQKSESARGRSTPIGGLPPPLLPAVVLSLAQAATDRIRTAASADRNAYLMV